MYRSMAVLGLMRAGRATLLKSPPLAPGCFAGAAVVSPARRAFASFQNQESRTHFRDPHVMPYRNPTSFQPFRLVVARLAIQQPGLW